MVDKRSLVLYLGTGNPHKAEEFSQIAPEGVTVIPAFSTEYRSPNVEESGETFFANAYLKAEAFSLALRKRHPGILFTDDSGLVVPAIKGEPGVKSARYAGDSSTDAQNRERLIKNLKGLAGEDRRAFFLCVLVAVDIATGSLLAAASGMVSGRIANGPMGEGGFGYDPVFIPEGFRASFGIMAQSEKNRISHRYRAFQKLCLALEGA